MRCAIIQARMGSTRLPGKGMKMIMGKPIIYFVVERVRRAKNIDKVIVAAPSSANNDSMCEYVKSLGIDVFRGSENDVLDRYYQAAKLYQADEVIRLTADCPLLDPQVIDQVVNYFKEQNVDYCSNITKRTFPDGQDVEICRFSVLEDAWKKATDTADREHVTKYIRLSGKYTIANFSQDENLGDLRWTLDYQEDLEFVTRIIEGLYPLKGITFTMQDILTFLKQHPEIEEINRKFA
ncbi:MAG: glycosyltransferase family protein [Candidatus Omnitrophica bacterium]|nr:glycosyltransferase family protein [Candidatus Omnitrophota bacterium]